VSVKVLPTSKAMSDLSAIAAHVKKYNDAAIARTVVNALLDEAERLGQDHFHRIGEELDGYDGPPGARSASVGVPRWTLRTSLRSPAGLRGRTYCYSDPSCLGHPARPVRPCSTN
jgi:plasmid stabilization system protein ParE